MRTHPTGSAIVATALSALLLGGTAGVATAAQQAPPGNPVTVSTPHHVPTCASVPGRWVKRWHSGYHYGPIVGYHNANHYAYVWESAHMMC